VLFAVGFVSLFALSVYGYLLIYQDLAVGGLFSLWCFPPFEGRMSYSSGKAERDAVYSKLKSHDRCVVDRALEYAARGQFENGVMSFVSDRSKSGSGSGGIEIMILRSYCDSYERFREGILGFYS
jgi:hypothetical protein